MDDLKCTFPIFIVLVVLTGTMSMLRVNCESSRAFTGVNASVSQCMNNEHVLGSSSTQINNSHQRKMIKIPSKDTNM